MTKVVTRHASGTISVVGREMVVDALTGLVGNGSQMALEGFVVERGSVMRRTGL